MAVDWIAVRKDLEDDPMVVWLISAVSQQVGTFVAPKCDTSRALSQRFVVTSCVVNALRRLWSIADGQTVDGVLPGYSPAAMDCKIEIPGLCELMAAPPGTLSPWMEIGPNSLSIPGFEKFMSESAKKRMTNTKRQDKRRVAPPRDKSTPPSATPVAPPRDKTAPPSATTGQDRTGQEKTGEEKRKQETFLDETSRDDQLDSLDVFSWNDQRVGALQEWCNHMFRAPGRSLTALVPSPMSEPDRSLLLKVGVLHLAGSLAEAEIVSARAAVLEYRGEKRIKKPIGYFHTVLAEQVKKAGPDDLNRLLALVKIPAELLEPRKSQPHPPEEPDHV